ncbi:MAG: NAD+ synthase [Planctomycetes bacterium]|nr:NAD+ synthase [Planctomycetota bacterium]
MKLGLLQTNPLVGDFEGNLAALSLAVRQAVAQGAELCIAPELALSGYPPHDLVFQQGFEAANAAAAARLVQLSAELHCGLLFGLCVPNERPWGKRLHNAALLCDNGRVIATKRKALLPTYDVFDERRYFEPDYTPCVAEFRGTRLGLLICEDIWTDESLVGRLDYAIDPADQCARAGAQLLVNISASPWGSGKHRVREQLVANAARRTGLFTVLVNQAGGNDDLIFDGGSVACDAGGATIARLPLFESSVAVVESRQTAAAPPWPGDDLELETRALQFGLAEYFRKTGHSRALIGLSGGIDSALVACLAARALGPANVHGITMPTRFSSKGSIEDSRELAANLGIGFEIVDIDEAFEQQRRLAGFPGGLAEENAQARLRGLVLMTRSNAGGALVLATGNQSELAVGYSTLYGDMCGALEVIGDVPKTRVFEMARRFAEIPDAIHTKPPSAELRPNQTDQDSLPPYDLLDRILTAYLDERLDAEQIAARGIDRELCRRVIRMVELAEYKRRQAPIVLRISGHAFGAGRRMPVVKKV